MRFWKGILTWSFQSCFSVWLLSVGWNCCLEEVTWTPRPLTRSHCVILLCAQGEGVRRPLVYSWREDIIARHKWGLTVSWSTIGWSQMQSDCPERSDDLCSMQNSLSGWSVPNRRGATLPAPLAMALSANRTEHCAVGPDFFWQQSHSFKSFLVLLVISYKWISGGCLCSPLYHRFLFKLRV